MCDCTLCRPGYMLDYDPRYIEAREASQASMREARERKYQEHIASLEKIPGAIRMFRTWRLYPNGDLKAMTQEHVWTPGENVTLASGDDASSDSGFYGFSTIEELKSQEAAWWKYSQSGAPNVQASYDHLDMVTLTDKYWYVCGTILMYGHVKTSEKGGRSQKAIPEYIIEPDGSDPDFGMLVVNAAEKYGMLIMTVEQAKELNTGVVPYWKGKDN